MTVTDPLAGSGGGTHKITETACDDHLSCYDISLQNINLWSVIEEGGGKGRGLRHCTRPSTEKPDKTGNLVA